MDNFYILLPFSFMNLIHTLYDKKVFNFMLLKSVYFKYNKNY